MIKGWLIVPLFVVLFFVSGCEDKTVEVDIILADDLITMENLDDYMFRDDVQYVDLRNYEARFRAGFIYSFEIIPFFDYLDYRAFNRNDTYEFNPDQILREQELERLFDRDKAIFLYDDGCIRSGYLKDVLNYLGYERVFILGGLYEYAGEHMISGDGEYTLGDTFYGKYTDEDNDVTYIVYGEFDLGRKIVDIRFDIIDSDNISFRSPSYNLDTDFNTQLTMLEDYIVFDMVTMNELYGSLSNKGDLGYNNIIGLTWEIDVNIINLINTLIPS